MGHSSQLPGWVTTTCGYTMREARLGEHQRTCLPCAGAEIDRLTQELRQRENLLTAIRSEVEIGQQAQKGRPLAEAIRMRATAFTAIEELLE